MHPRVIWHKRKGIQELRKVPDSRILEQLSYRFYDPEETDGLQRIVVKALNTLFYAYCVVMRLKTRDLKRQ